jgi:hypothetical protein
MGRGVAALVFVAVTSQLAGAADFDEAELGALPDDARAAVLAVHEAVVENDRAAFLRRVSPRGLSWLGSRFDRKALVTRLARQEIARFLGMGVHGRWRIAYDAEKPDDVRVSGGHNVLRFVKTGGKWILLAVEAPPMRHEPEDPRVFVFVVDLVTLTADDLVTVRARLGQQLDARSEDDVVVLVALDHRGLEVKRSSNPVQERGRLDEALSELAPSSGKGLIDLSEPMRQAGILAAAGRKGERSLTFISRATLQAGDDLTGVIDRLRHGHGVLVSVVVVGNDDRRLLQSIAEHGGGQLRIW